MSKRKNVIVEQSEQGKALCARAVKLTELLDEMMQFQVPSATVGTVAEVLISLLWDRWAELEGLDPDYQGMIRSEIAWLQLLEKGAMTHIQQQVQAEKSLPDKLKLRELQKESARGNNASSKPNTKEAEPSSPQTPTQVLSTGTKPPASTPGSTA